jgi:hypothetical protein
MKKETRKTGTKKREGKTKTVFVSHYKKPGVDGLIERKKRGFKQTKKKRKKKKRKGRGGGRSRRFANASANETRPTRIVRTIAQKIMARKRQRLKYQTRGLPM